MPSRSEQQSSRVRRRTLIALLAVMLLVPAGIGLADVISTGQFLLLETEVQSEDAYVAANSGTVAGRIDGDLVIATPQLTISGVVTGDVLVASQGTVSVTGDIEGSLRGVARRVLVTGTVGDDVAVASLDVMIGGVVGRDVVALADELRITGSTGRDLLGRVRVLEVAGSVGGDVDVTVDRISIESIGEVGGDVVYQSSRDIAVADRSTVGGQIVDLPSRAPFFQNVVMRLALLIGFLGFLVAGVVSLGLFRGTAEAAMAALVERPVRVAVAGLATVIGVPLLIGLLIATLAGIPIAVLLIFALALSLIFGPVPVVTVIGAWTLRNRGEAVAGFLLGGTVWALLVIFLPVLGSLIAGIVIVLGIGAWVTGALTTRRAARWPALPSITR